LQQEVVDLQNKTNLGSAEISVAAQEVERAKVKEQEAVACLVAAQQRISTEEGRVTQAQADAAVAQAQLYWTRGQSSKK